MLLHESCNEESISGINKDLEDHFTLCLNKIINRFVIFNNQTESIVASLIHKFVAVVNITDLRIME